ncbi:IS1249 family transposase [Corynebacterium hindlerae]|uniref:IS1249 family transposase n=1 Tax=Corynebacterium hindlerae TaxID=699041 RepID=UPI001AD6A977|nr:IS1249 family transposase [Corynebacterium hindlerae]QTH58682.1 IS1249 family transposase [Corynebacterium hindlerae]QTH59351.1 IS1249 family transposase [Corynebacterium hindlerae]QTH59797.1 IS1249 family transposase [Corynebacterium hindlerae]QTH60505.1 IS1249 family transposase [Corynebacterium hindlerae]
MNKNRPRCPICQGQCKKNGTTSTGTTRWRCTTCGASTTKSRPDLTQAANFRAFHSYAIGQRSLTEIGADQGCDRRTLQRRFHTFWLIDIPCAPDPHRVYDQVFIDATYTQAGCLLIASTLDHVLCWHWDKRETTAAYTALLKQLAPPLCVVLDGGQGAYSAIKTCWPKTKIQRCLVHAQRVIRRYTTSRPRTDAGKAIYALALTLTTITTVEQAADWTARLHEYGQLYHDFLNEKTILPKERNPNGDAWEYTHIRVRKAYNSLMHLHRKKWLFTFLQPPKSALHPHRWKATTNSLEGGINAQLKLLARLHRGRGGERQRRMIEWWLHSKTQLPDDPLDIARQQRFGQDALAKVTALTQPNESQANQETGRPALYDNAIPTEYQHNIGIQKGTLG